MAFVNQTERKINPVSKTVCPLGPGQYFVQQSHSITKACAPFDSSNGRRSIFQQTGKPQPGPGDYENTKPFIEPNIKTVSNSQSIIVKINSTGTSQFKSMINRFHSNDRKIDEPGPGQYNYQQIKPKRSISNSFIRQNKLSETVKIINGGKQSYPTIPQRVRGLTDAKVEEVPKPQTLGPGCYNYNEKIHGNLTSTVWGKDRTRRFSIDQKNEVGPGKYNAQYKVVKPEDKIKQPYFAYKSNTVRTFFDSLIYRTNLSQTADLRNKQKFKSKEPAPGQYDTKVSALKVQQKPFAFQFFGSTVERFPEQEIEQKKHKSFYNVKSEIGNNRSFNKVNHSFMNSQSREPSFLEVKASLPGPGHYADKVKVQKKLRGVNLQQFGSTTKRPFHKKQEKDEIGPGKYLKEENEDESIIDRKRFGQVKETSSHFRSSTKRNCFGDVKNDVPFAEYDVTHYDLSKKIQKQKNFIQNLKKIEVERAPFESSISRFPHYEDKKIPTQFKKSEQAKMNELFQRQQSQKVRDNIIEDNRNQIIEKTKYSRFSKDQRFKNNNRGAPGVGVYNLKSNWEHKSHNIKYQHNK